MMCALCSETRGRAESVSREAEGYFSLTPLFPTRVVSATLVPLAEASVSVIASCQGPGSRDSMDANSCKMRVVTYEASGQGVLFWRAWLVGWEVGEGIYK